jgi:diacylglycerol kinase family enzyme
MDAFVNNASVGLYPYAIVERDLQQKVAARGKRLASFLAAVKTFFRLPLVRAQIQVGNTVVERFTPFVFVGNNAYSLQLRREKLRPRLDGGELCVIAARGGGMRCMLRLMFDAWRNRLADSADLDLWHGPEVIVKTKRDRRRAALDGEVVTLESPILFRSVPGALRVIAPPAS